MQFDTIGSYAEHVVGRHKGEVTIDLTQAEEMIKTTSSAKKGLDGPEMAFIRQKVVETAPEWTE